MRINSISPILLSGVSKQNSAQNTDNHITKYQNTSLGMDSLAFHGVRTLVKAPEMKDMVNEEVFNKMRTLLQKLPNSCKTIKPILFNIKDNAFAMTIDKSNPARTQIIIKDMITKIEEWENYKVGQSVMICNFDKDGQMLNGEYMKRLKSNFSDIIRFERLSKTSRKLHVEGKTFAPTRGCIDTWGYHGSNSRCPDPSMTIDLSTRIFPSGFSEIFTKLTRRDTCII